jgi:hypothetical protein
MDNYTRPKDESYEDSPEDLLAGLLVFSQALNVTIPQGEGVLIVAKGDAEAYFAPKGELLIIANMDGQIQVMALKDVLDDTTGFTEGMWITVGAPDEEDTID